MWRGALRIDRAANYCCSLPLPDVPKKFRWRTHGLGPLAAARVSLHIRGAGILRSSDIAERGFCASCGSPLIYRDKTDELGVPVGTLDHPENWPPNASHGGIESKVPWEVITDDLPQYTTDEDPLTQQVVAAAKRVDEQSDE